MTVQNFFVLTSAQRDTADQGGVGWGAGQVELGARAIDNLSPGTGLNLNDNASDYDPADPVSLTGCFVTPKHMVDDPEYNTYAPQMLAFLLTLPWCMLESETIFAPEVPI